MTSLKPKCEWDDEDTPRRMFIKWLTCRLEEQYGAEAPSIAIDVAAEMGRIKLSEWCDREGCFKQYCSPDSYVFNLTTAEGKYDLGDG